MGSKGMLWLEEVSKPPVFSCTPESSGVPQLVRTLLLFDPLFHYCSYIIQRNILLCGTLIFFAEGYPTSRISSRASLF